MWNWELLPVIFALGSLGGAIFSFTKGGAHTVLGVLGFGVAGLGFLIFDIQVTNLPDVPRAEMRSS